MTLISLKFGQNKRRIVTSRRDTFSETIYIFLYQMLSKVFVSFFVKLNRKVSDVSAKKMFVNIEIISGPMAGMDCQTVSSPYNI